MSNRPLNIDIVKALLNLVPNPKKYVYSCDENEIAKHIYSDTVAIYSWDLDEKIETVFYRETKSDTIYYKIKYNSTDNEIYSKWNTYTDIIEFKDTVFEFCCDKLYDFKGEQE